MKASVSIRKRSDTTLTANRDGDLVKSLCHGQFPLGLLLLGISQGFFSFLSPGFCSLGSLLSINLGSIGTLPRFYRSLQLGPQS
jgi:hypothetical protein